MATLATARVQGLLKAGDLRSLFIEELGWDRHRASVRVTIDGQEFQLLGIAEKRGLVAFECRSATGKLPSYRERIAVEAEVRKQVHEHLIVFMGERAGVQVWQWVRREAGRPRATREHQFHVGQPGDSLIAKLDALAFDLAEEESLTIAHVTARTRRAFDVESVTRRFFERFQQEHKAFLKFVQGFAKASDAEWYASLMLNRLMFVYFIQKRGFLDGDRDYLQTRLRAVQTQGPDGFHNFYRYFLLRLFHDGLSAPAAQRDPSLEQLLGEVPYLNGGLFDVHVLEQTTEQIDIPDAAFERLFAFFDSYNWHLDDRPLQSDNEINPDVLGFIFEKYINQKQMGAYYTKEDITGYITGNVLGIAILARLQGQPLLDRLRALMADRPDRYLPPDLLADPQLGESADAAAERAAQVEERRASLSSTSMSWTEMVAANIDLTVALEDAVQIADSDELRQVWFALNTLTVLDPTCGSGAFLFAAVRVLEPLLEACVQRMALLVDGNEGSPETLVEYRSVLEELGRHPNQQYFILKSILLNNLYGVDIMEEAVEICKLRLFLKLASTLATASELEPLPDIDFNIRPGNSIVGFDTVEALRSSVASTLDFDGELHAIEAACTEVDRAYNDFRIRQESGHDRTLRPHKEALASALARLQTRVNSHLLDSLGVSNSAADAWLEETQPFHWFGEFHEILAGGGFDAIIGNPPYAEVPKHLSRQYLQANYRTALERWSRDEDLYTFVVERSLRLLRANGALGMVLPLSASFSTKRSYVALREQLAGQTGTWWLSHYDRIPSALFGNDVRTRCTIALYSRHLDNAGVFVTELRRWPTSARDQLFGTLKYSRISGIDSAGVPKLGGQAQAIAYEALSARGSTLAPLLTKSPSFPSLAAMAPNFPKNSVFVGGTAYNWFPVWREIPPTTDEQGRPSLPARTACFSFATGREADLVFALLGSSLGYWWWAVAGDGFNLKKWLLERFPLSPRDLTTEAKEELSRLGGELRKELKEHYVYKDNRGRVGNWYMPACRDQIDAIDAALVQYVPELTQEAMDEIRSFNRRFSTAENNDAGT